MQQRHCNALSHIENKLQMLIMADKQEKSRHLRRIFHYYPLQLGLDEILENKVLIIAPLEQAALKNKNFLHPEFNFCISILRRDLKMFTAHSLFGAFEPTENLSKQKDK